jgi:O-6-methylguanine DNA methyltransferase
MSPKLKSNFTEQVYAIVGKIPKGKVSTYKDVAIAAGRPGAARTVGSIMRKNASRPRSDSKKVPCHRVVGSDGKMHGFAFGKGESTKAVTLKREGVCFSAKAKDKVDLEKSQFDFGKKKS